MGGERDGTTKKRAPVEKEQVTMEPKSVARATISKVPEVGKKGPAVRVEYLDESEEMDISLTGGRSRVPLSTEVFDVMLSPPESPVVHSQPRGELEAAGKDEEVRQIQALGACVVGS